MCVVCVPYACVCRMHVCACVCVRARLNTKQQLNPRDLKNEVERVKWNGSPAFFPPEVVKGIQKKISGPKADVWAAGVIL